MMGYVAAVVAGVFAGIVFEKLAGTDIINELKLELSKVSADIKAELAKIKL